MGKCKGIKTVLLFSLITFYGQAQQLNLPLNRMMNLEWENEFSARDSFSLHTSFKPVTENKILTYRKFQEYNSTKVKKHFAWLFADKNWIKRKTKWENLYEAKGEDFYFDVNPVFNFEYGRDLANNNAQRFSKNSRGVVINANITSKFSFSTSFTENQAFVPLYLRLYSADISVERFDGVSWKIESPVVPGQGRAKLFKGYGYDFAWSQGYFSYSPSEKINIQFGHGKLFVGEGYRSMLLSDNAFNYPHLRITTSWWKNRIQYTTVFASLTRLRRLINYTSTEATFEKKAAVINYLDVQLTKRIQLGIFESVIWKRMGVNQELLPIDYSFFNPLISVNTMRFGLNTENNVLAGLNAKYQPFKKLYFYGQLAIDDPANGKVGWQLGGKWFDPLGFDDASVQVEVNSAGGRMYAHDDVRQNYSHYNQPLAHPSGGGFFEFITIGNYRMDDYFFEYKFNYITYKEFSSGNLYNKDILISELEEPDPSETFTHAQLFYQEATAGYLINPKYNMNMIIGWLHRGLHNVKTPHNTSYFYIGFRTSLSNFYYDY